MITKDEVIKRINERVRLHDPRLHFDEREENAPMIHAVIGVLVDLINGMVIMRRGEDQATCCFVDENGQQCPLKATFITIGPTNHPDDYSYACGDHAKDLAGDRDDIVRLVDGVTVRKAKG